MRRMIGISFLLLCIIVLSSCGLDKTAANPPEIEEKNGSLYITVCKSVIDVRTGIEWYIGPDKLINYHDYKNWLSKIKNCDGNCCDKNWRIPTRKEIATLYIKNDEGKTAKMEIEPKFVKIVGGTQWAFWSSEHGSSYETDILDIFILATPASDPSSGFSDLRRSVAVRNYPIDD